MAGSYRGDLNSGHMPEWESELLEACIRIEGIVARVYAVAYEEDQTDNAADDGGLAEKLSLAARLVREELPKRPKEAPDA